MTDTYMMNGEPVARYEGERLAEAEAELARFADPETLAGNLSISVEQQVQDRIRAGARYPHTALAKVQEIYSRWAKDEEAKKAFYNWRVTLDHNSPEAKPGCGIDDTGHTIPRIYFLPLDPDGALAQRFGAEFAAVYHHSAQEVTFTDSDGNEVKIQDGFTGYHGIVRLYNTMAEAEEDANRLAAAIRTLAGGAGSPYTDDPARKVREYPKPESF